MGFYFKILKYFLFFFVLSFGYIGFIGAQQVNLSSSDEKKIAKADKDALKADDLNKEADKIYIEIATKQASLTAEETDKLNNKALEKQIGALKIQQEANKVKYAIYAGKADEFWKNFKGNPDEMGFAKSLESNARLNYQAAEIQYNDALGSKDKLIAYTRMTSSADMFIKALNDMKQAFGIYSGKELSSSAPVVSTPAYSSPAPDSIQPAPTATSQVITDTLSHVVVAESTPAYVAPLVNDTIVSTPITPAPAALPDSTSVAPAVSTPVTENQTYSEPVIPAVDPNASNIYQAVKVNELMIDRFNKFLQDNYPTNYEKYIIDFGSMDFSDIESVRKAWYQRMYGDKYYMAMGEDPPSVLPDTQNQQVSSDSVTLPASQTLASNVEVANSVGENTTSPTNQDVAKKPEKRSSKKKKVAINTGFDSSQEVSNYTGFTDTVMATGFVYRVQVMACRVPVSSNELSRKYTGTMQVAESIEDGWYKYTIGPFNSFSVARDSRMSCGVEGAFVAAYLNGKRINASGDLVKAGKSVQSYSNFSVQGDYTFKVQVAASRVELTDNQLKRIYVNTEMLAMSNEDNWYKYTIDCGNDYGKAFELVKNIGVPGAFIAVYKDNVRIDYKEFLRNK